MAWVAEILRKNHRTCHRCRLGPTHVYDPPSALLTTQDDPEEDVVGDLLCNGCLAVDLERDLSRYEARCIVFEPSLGPDSLVFRAAPGIRHEADDQSRALLAALATINSRCSGCDNPARFLWVPVEPDANLWQDDWLVGLADGSLVPTDSLCGGCVAKRLMHSIEKRGLYFDTIVPPRGDDGILCGGQV